MPTRLVPVKTIFTLATIMLVSAKLVSADEVVPTESNASDPKSIGSITDVHLIVVTDDDFLSDAPIWCHRVLDRILTHATSLREETLPWEVVRCGPPAILNRGVGQSPKRRRALCFWVDQDRRLLGFSVGLPDRDGFLKAWEDVDEYLAAAQLVRPDQTAGNLEGTGDAESPEINVWIALAGKRAAERVSRHYRSRLDAMRRDISFTENAHLVQAAFKQDIRERYLLQTVQDWTRLVSIEQHAETRMHWCNAILPHVIGKPFDDMWAPITEEVWRANVWQPSGAAIAADTTESGSDTDAETVEPHAWFQSSTSSPLVVKLVTRTNYVGQSILGIGNAPVPTKAVPTKMVSAKKSTPPKDQLASHTMDLRELAILLHQAKRQPISFRNTKLKSSPEWIVWNSPDDSPKFFPAEAQDRIEKLLRAQPE